MPDMNSMLVSGLLSPVAPAPPRLDLLAHALASQTPAEKADAERITRAKSMGFHTRIPLYHGTNAEFDAFDPTIASAKTNNPAAQSAIFAAGDPETAAEFAGKASPTSSPRVLHLLHRAQRPASLDLDGTETNQEIAATLKDAFDKGHDAVRMTNYTTPAGKKGKVIFAIKHPSQLRLASAAFDPQMRESALLSA